jgi:membrane-bound lytic murein transglycosylase A
MTLTRFAISALCCLTLTGCEALSWPPPPQKSAEHLTLEKSSFDQLPGWNNDAQGEAVIALQRSCAPIMKKDRNDNLGVGDFAGTAAAWQGICQDLADAVPLTDIEARAFFQAHFTPYEMQGGNGPEGLFTGYYEPTLHGSYRKHGHYTVPIYGRPNDLVTVNLGEFKPGLEGEHIVGRVDKDKDLVPYYDREEIEDGALKKQHKEIVWVDNAVDAFFLHVQGSGRIEMDNGKTLRVGYAAENGQTYTAIGRALVARGALDKSDVSMQSIRDWLEQNPDDAADVMDINASYIFFRKLKGDDGPLGAEGVPLTPRRSLAVDRKVVPYGVPIWLDAEDPDGAENMQQLMVAQDTGGAIVGAVRGDFFWGAGDEAAHKAGLMKSKGRAWVLLPKAAEVAEKEAAPQEDPVRQEENRFSTWYNHIVNVLQSPLSSHGQ